MGSLQFFASLIIVQKSQPVNSRLQRRFEVMRQFWLTVSPVASEFPHFAFFSRDRKKDYSLVINFLARNANSELYQLRHEARHVNEVN